MSNLYYNDSILSSYETERLRYDYDITQARRSIKERIKALEAVIESIEYQDDPDEEQLDQLESAREELHDLRRELDY